MTTRTALLAICCLSLLACAFPQDALKAEDGEAQTGCPSLVEPTDDDIRRFREAENISLTREEVDDLAQVFDEVEKCRSNGTIALPDRKVDFSMGYDFHEARYGKGDLFFAFVSDTPGMFLAFIVYVRHDDGSSKYFRTIADALYAVK